MSRGLYDLADVLSHSAKELVHIATRLNEVGNEAEAKAVLRIGLVMQAGEDRLVGYGDEVKTGRILRAKE
nr:hypothetical protein [Pseudomonas asiatica]